MYGTGFAKFGKWFESLIEERLVADKETAKSRWRKGNREELNLIAALRNIFRDIAFSRSFLFDASNNREILINQTLHPHS
jgi:hypothetical protein